MGAEAKGEGMAVETGRVMDEPEISNKLSMDFEHFPRQEVILANVMKGEALFRKVLRECGLSEHDADSSQVHSYDDVAPQAFFQAVPSMHHPDEIVIKTLLTYGAHFLDDLFDRPDRTEFGEEMYRYRHDFMRLLDALGPFGVFTHRIARMSQNPEFVYKGVHRMLYGGLIQLSRTSGEQDMFLREYKEVGMKGVSEDVKRKIREMRDVAYWVTTKVVQEIFLSAEPDPNFTTCELWNLAGSPVIYLHDNEEEEVAGELNFFEKEKPRDGEMLDIVDYAVGEIEHDDNDRMFERYLQVKFLNHSFARVLSDEFAGSYRHFEDVLLMLSRRDVTSVHTAGEDGIAQGY